MPLAGDKVTIAAAKNVVLDVTPPALGGVTIEGTLSFADTADLELTTEWIMVHGELEIGTEARPHTRKATITLTDNVKDEDMSGVGGATDRSDRGVMIMGGTLSLHGNRTNSWTKLSRTAEAGSTSIDVLNAAGWRAGDEIVLASTDFDPRQAVRRTIAGIRGNTITRQETGLHAFRQDLRHDVVNTTFRNYKDNATRKTGALSYLMFTSFAVTCNNTVERVKFVDAKPVYFPPMANNARWASDNGSSVAWKTAVIRDKDGSLGGGPDTYVLINDGVIDSIAIDAQACEHKAAWNAVICNGDVWRLGVGGPGGGGRFGGARGGSAPRAGGARAAPAQPPVVLSRNGKEFELTATTVRAGTEIKVATERPTVSLTLTELNPGSWVVFELPGFTTAASGAEQSSLGALRAANATSYYKGPDALWVKIVSTADGGRGGGGSLQVNR